MKKRKLQDLLDYKILHGRELCNIVYEQFEIPDVKVSKDIKILTVLDKGDNILSKSKILDNPIEFIYVDHYEKWITKIEHIKNYIDSNYSNLPDYIMYLDAHDCLILNDINSPQSILDHYNCKMLFNSESNFTHTGCLKHSTEYYRPLYTTELNRYVNLNLKKYNYPYDFGLNAGVFLGEKEFVQKIITEVYNYMVDSEYKGFPYGCTDDQCVLRYVLNEHFDYIAVDFENIFSLWGTKITFLEDWIGQKLGKKSEDSSKEVDYSYSIIESQQTHVSTPSESLGTSKDQVNISFYGSHNGAYVVERNGEILLVLELERFFNYKNSGLAQYKCPKVSDILFYAKYIPRYICEKLNIDHFDNCIALNTDVIIDKSFSLEKFIPAKKYTQGLHHQAHASGCFYQSPYDKMLIFSFDGGGNDGKFNIYLAERKTGVKLIDNILNPVLNNPHVHYDLGFPYMIFGHYLKDIKLEVIGDGNLVYPGKLMGLSSYGNVREEWLDKFINFYKNNPDGNTYEKEINKLGEQINVKFCTQNRLEGQLAWDIAATSQKAFEECFLEIAKPYFDKFPDHPIGITGGCGLNILLNTRIVKEFNKKVFVGPNPNDCGIALGLMLDYIKPENPVDVTYSGLELLDKDSLLQYVDQSNVKSSIVDLSTIVEDLIDGKIIGVARGRSEHGPRALGNRSIICNPTLPDMKDVLNFKVKNREWYRPFAPVVRLEDVQKYFEWDQECTWMSFCPTVKEEWRETLKSITHIDNTARVQTVTREQNSFLYDLLTKFEESTGVGVLLNTSFNVDGKPILSTIKDAFTILDKTQLDCLLIEDSYIRKN